MLTLVGAVALAAGVALLPFFALTLAVTIAASWRRGRPGREAEPARLLVVVPAHDEEGGIGATVRSCLAADYPRGRLEVLVIADNCLDGTAREAAEAGARVYQRTDHARRSKGFALEDFFGDLFRTGEADGFDAVVLVDADTVVDPMMFRRFSEALASGADWLQCYYTVRNPDASRRTRLMTYAFALINGTWPLGMDRLGLGAPLRGNGMCFSTRGLRRVPWRAAGLVEDVEFSWRLRLAGERVRFVPTARVFGEMVSGGGRAAADQRLRWEAGRRALRRSFTGQVLRAPGLGPLRKAIYLTELWLPPLSELATAVVAFLAIDVVVASTPGGAARLAVHGLLAMSLLAYLISPFANAMLPPRYLAALASAPAFVAWKAAVGLRRRPGTWVRTRREKSDGASLDAGRRARPDPVAPADVPSPPHDPAEAIRIGPPAARRGAPEREESHESPRNRPAGRVAH